MKTDTPVIVRRTDYKPPVCLVDTVDLHFELDPDDTRVRARLAMRRNPAAAEGPLVLDGEQLETLAVRLDGVSLPLDRVLTDDHSLTLDRVPESFVLETEVRIRPQANTTLNGLYTSGGNFFTQCEAEGFRRITWFADRPDVMARYTVTLHALRDASPVLLSNGNLVAEGESTERDGWHWARWEDPFPKPSYLFALVAGRLVATERVLRGSDGRDKLLQVWVQPGNEDKTAHAMESLVRAIRWDEERFGLPLDLDRFMIVAVDDFNMGAMENKGLNIFNTKYVFANPRIATDTDFLGVESVVGHEYFHNWTGNRVTCRDWFQLTLKEGLTVFRDQEFSADVLAAEAGSEAQARSARAVKRIDDVRLLRTAQFAEDAGPMAHPIRPESYSEINNFYTVTIYEKGAEVIRMMQTLVGRDGFRRGMDLYFQRHDGQAVTCDDFLAAIADANGRDLTQFGRWYSQAGTPLVRVHTHHDASARTYTLTLEQSCAPTPGQARKEPMLIPLAIGLLAADGSALPLHLQDEAVPMPADGPSPAGATTRVLEFANARQSFVFTGIDSPPIPSLLRNFSAPVTIDYPWHDDELAFLVRHDSDPFNRWESAQRLAVTAVLGVLDGADPRERTRTLVDALAGLLDDTALDPAFQAQALALPGEGYIAEQLTLIDPVALRAARVAVRDAIATGLEGRLHDALTRLRNDGPYRADAAGAGRRALRNLALALLVGSGDPAARAIAAAQVEAADNMTDRAGALAALVASDAPQRETALAWFEREFEQEPLVLDKWFMLQATMPRQPGDPPVLERVRRLMSHPRFSIRNPNRVRALVGSFCSGNLAEFHARDADGYDFWLQQVLALDAINPQVAARLARALDRWRKFDAHRQARMRGALERLAACDGLSRDVAEIVSKALAVASDSDGSPISP